MTINSLLPSLWDCVFAFLPNNSLAKTMCVNRAWRIQSLNIARYTQSTVIANWIKLLGENLEKESQASLQIASLSQVKIKSVVNAINLEETIELMTQWTDQIMMMLIDVTAADLERLEKLSIDKIHYSGIELFFYMINYCKKDIDAISKISDARKKDQEFFRLSAELVQGDLLCSAAKVRNYILSKEGRYHTFIKITKAAEQCRDVGIFIEVIKIMHNQSHHYTEYSYTDYRDHAFLAVAKNSIKAGNLIRSIRIGNEVVNKEFKCDIFGRCAWKLVSIGQSARIIETTRLIVSTYSRDFVHGIIVEALAEKGDIQGATDVANEMRIRSAKRNALNIIRYFRELKMHGDKEKAIGHCVNSNAT